MTAPLQHLLDELADDVARAAPSADPLALWASGRRRRRDRRVQALAGGLAVVLLALLLVPIGVVRSPAQWAGPSTSAVSDFPARLGRQWWVRSLPNRPGPLALLVQGGPSAPQVWYGVAPDGTRWRLPEVAHRTDQYPTLSPDGRLLGYLVTEDGPYVLHDLVTGERREVEGVSDNRGTSRARHQLGGQVPTHWSRDGRQAVLPALQPVLLDVVTGDLTPVATPAGAVLAGFAGDDELVWLRAVPPDGGVIQVQSLEAVVTDVAGREERVVRVPSGPHLVAGLSQWSGAVSPDGSQVAVVSGPSAGLDGGQVDRYDLRTGRQSASTVAAADVPACGPAWGEQLVVPGSPDGSGPLAVAVDGDRPESVVVVEDGADLRCAVWATGALVDGGGRALLGTSTAWWSWWWPEVLAGGLLVLLARLVWRRSPRGAQGFGWGRWGRRRGSGSGAGADWYA